MNSENNIEQIYDWLEHCSFDSLSKVQQEFVLSVMDEDLYNEMHLAIRASGKLFPGKNARSNIKQNVLEHFDSGKTHIPLYLFMNQKVSIGKAAIWIALLSGAFMWSLIRGQTVSTKDLTAMLSDTVYVEVPVQVISKVTDTVRVSKGINIDKSSLNQGEQLITMDQSLAQLESDLHIVHAVEQHSDLNSTRNNSLKYDSLAGKIGFVSL